MTLAKGWAALSSAIMVATLATPKPIGFGLSPYRKAFPKPIRSLVANYRVVLDADF